MSGAKPMAALMAKPMVKPMAKSMAKPMAKPEAKPMAKHNGIVHGLDHNKDCVEAHGKARPGIDASLASLRRLGPKAGALRLVRLLTRIGATAVAVAAERPAGLAGPAGPAASTALRGAPRLPAAPRRIMMGAGAGRGPDGSAAALLQAGEVQDAGPVWARLGTHLLPSAACRPGRHPRGPATRGALQHTQEAHSQ